MKKIIFPILTLLLIAGGSSCQEKIDIEKEKEAIKAVVEKETNAFWARDLDQQLECFIQDETTTWVNAGRDGLGDGDGWENIRNSYIREFLGKDDFYENYPESNRKVKNKYYKIKVYKDCAWVVYDEYYVFENDSIIDGPKAIRFLEKVDDEWKLVLLSNHSREDTKEEDPDAED